MQNMQNNTQNMQTLNIAPKVRLDRLQNLFFQLNTVCNLKCKYCYVKKNTKDDYIELEKIKNALLALRSQKLNSVYLTGGEPLMHPDFNKILRMCLKVTNVTVMSNGVMINDKKARFLRKIDDESNFETIYRISLDSTTELEHDAQRGRGSFRKALSAIFSLIKYEFNPIISVVDFKNRGRREIFEEFASFFSKKGYELENINLKVIPCFMPQKDCDCIPLYNTDDIKYLDCSNSRTVTQTGVYSCPLLADDYRARLGSSLDDYSKVNYLDCEKCALCTSIKAKVMVNDWM